MLTYRHIVKGEIKKLWSNKLFLLLLVFLALICAYVTSRQSATVPSWQEELDQLLAAYEISPEETEAEVRERVAALDKWELLLRGTDEDGEPFTLTEEQAEEFRHRAPYQKFLALLDREDTYRETLSTVIRTARKNYDNYISAGIPAESFVVRYQIGVVSHYTEQLNWDMEFPVGQVRGYDYLLENQSYPIFLCLALLMGAVLLLLPEKNGMLSLLRSTKGGRCATILAKLATGACMSAVLTVGFFLLSSVILVAKTGLSGALLPLQYVYATAPYHTSVLGGLLLRLLTQAALGTLFVWCVLLLTIPLRHTVSALGAGGGMIAASYLLGVWGKKHPHNPFHLFNMMTIMDSSSHLSQWNSFYLGTWSVDYLITLPIVLSVALLLIGAFNVWAFAGRYCPLVLTAAGRYSRLQAAIDWMGQTVRREIARRMPKMPRRSRRYGSFLPGWEWRKIRRRMLTVICLALLLISEARTLWVDYAPLKTYSNRIYHEYMTLYEGPWNEEKSAAIRAEQQRLSSLMAARDTLAEKYEAGNMDETTFHARYAEANDAEMRLQVFDAITERDRTLRELHEQGYEVSFVYDTGWNLYLQDTDFDAAAAVVILLLAGMLADEYVSGFSSILRTTRRGRRSTWRSKVAVMALFALGISLLQNAGRLLVLSLHYDLPAGEAPALSLSGMEALPWKTCDILTLTGGVVLMRMAGLLVLAMLTVGLSAVCRQVLPTVLISALSVYLSRLLSLFELDLLNFWTLDNTLCALPLLLNDTARTAALVSVGVAIGLLWPIARKRWREA